VVDGRHDRKKAKRHIRHPLPTQDRGFYDVDCATDLSAYSPDEIADMVLHVNNNATNAFMQQIRRRLSILERPLVTARGDGKSYIYANFNPKYGHSKDVPWRMVKIMAHRLVCHFSVKFIAKSLSVLCVISIFYSKTEPVIFSRGTHIVNYESPNLILYV
jgi:hypothetical protein